MCGVGNAMRMDWLFALSAALAAENFFFLFFFIFFTFFDWNVSINEGKAFVFILISLYLELSLSLSLSWNFNCMVIGNNFYVYMCTELRNLVNCWHDVASCDPFRARC